MASSRTRTFVLAVLLTGTTLAGAPFSPAAAQQPSDADERWHPEWGDWSLAFHIPRGGGGGFGFWNQVGENLALGLSLDASVTQSRRETPMGEEEATAIQAGIGPVLKRYWWTDGPVAPFFHLGMRAIYNRSQGPGFTEEPAPSHWRLGGAASLGLGADWFPVEGISIGGHTGVAGSYFWLTNDDDVRNDRTHIQGSLFTSALTLHLYF